MRNQPEIADRLGRLAVLGLREQPEIPHKIDALGVREAHIEALAKEASVDPSAPTNPRPVSVADFATLFQCALAGELPRGAR